MLGRDIAGKIKQYCIGIYQDCAKYAEAKGVIIADTKFEFGIDNDGKICLADEILTPGSYIGIVYVVTSTFPLTLQVLILGIKDSSRFWPIDDYCAGRPQSRLNCASFIFIHKCLISYGMTLSHNSYDKQYIRDYLVKMNFDKKTPTYLSDKIAKETRNKYITLYEKITSKRWSK